MKHVYALALILSASPLAAQQVVSIKSGKHDGFSRLVLQIDPSVDWQVTEAAGLATIQFPQQTLSFNTAEIFARISTDQIASVSGEVADDASSLLIKLNCQCDVQAFAFKENYIVIDVFDGAALDPAVVAHAAPQWQPDALPFIQPSNAPLQFKSFVMAEAPLQPHLLPDPPPEAAPEPAPQMAEPAMPDMVADFGQGGAVEENIVEDMSDTAGAVVADMNNVVTAEENPELQARIEEAQNQLLAQLTRAADQGLVEFVPAPVPVAEVEEHLPEPELDAAPEAPEMSAELLQQLSARTAYSQGTEDALSEIVNQFAMPQCQNDADFSMDGWGGDAGFSEQLASLRRHLLGEFDAPNSDIAVELVQLYLRYGLGAEARLMLQETGVPAETAPLYADMAALMEGEVARVEGPVLKGAGCGGAHEMWYLATGHGDYQVLEPLTITDVFSTYPIEVRALIGPLLAQAFIARGQVEAGHVVLEIVRRAESGVTTAQRMAEAQVMEANGNHEAAAKVYRELALGTGDSAPEALIAYARNLLQSDSHLPDTLLVDMEAASFFNRDTKSADPLRLWEIRVRHEIKGADAGLAQIKETIAERPHLEDELRAMTSDIFEHTHAETLGDYPYAQMVLEYSDMLDQGPAGDAARLKIAEEMASIGLPETALDVLLPNLGRADSPTRHIEAAAYVQLFQPSKALSVLDGDESLASYKIMLDAYLQMEDFAAVAELLNNDHAKDISLNDVALRAGDWEKIKDAGAVGTLASYVQDGLQAPEMTPDEMLPHMQAQEEPSLEAARELLVNNQESMQFLEDVLADGR